MLRLACWVWAVVALLVMWVPDPEFGGVDLTSPVLQGATFGLGALLFALADAQRPSLAALRRDPCQPLAYLVISFRRHLVRVGLQLVLYSAVLEVGQSFVVHRTFRIGQFGENAGWILMSSAAVYGLARIVLANVYLSRITQRHLERASAALRVERVYAAYLRDVIKAGCAICAASSLPVEHQIDRIGRLLDRALGAAMPEYGEERRDAIFAPTEATPAPYRPSLKPAVSSAATPKSP